METKPDLKLKISEHKLQSSLFEYVILILPSLRPYIFAIPNGGHRNIVVAKKLKAEGVTRGIPDIFLCIPNGRGKHGLFIECKVNRNSLTNEQSKFKDMIRRIGFEFKVCKNLEDFEEIIKSYFQVHKLNDLIIQAKLKKFINDFAN